MKETCHCQKDISPWPQGDAQWGRTARPLWCSGELRLAVDVARSDGEGDRRDYTLCSKYAKDKKAKNMETNKQTKQIGNISSKET